MGPAEGGAVNYWAEGYTVGEMGGLQGCPRGNYLVLVPEEMVPENEVYFYS